MAKKPRPIPRRARLDNALRMLKLHGVNVEDLMAYRLALFEKREVVDQARKQGSPYTVAEWLADVKADDDYPVLLGNDIFERAIAMAERYKL